MAMAGGQQVFGTVSEWEMDTDMTEWVERLEQWFVANDIENAERKRALFLSFIGKRGYHLLRGLSQKNPTEKCESETKRHHSAICVLPEAETEW